MEKCADAITDWLIRCEMIKDTDKELYQYAVYSVFLSLSPLLLAVGFGICMGCVRESVMIIIPFVIIRKFSGGYHTKHAWTCLTGSCLLLLLCIALSCSIKCGKELAVLTVGAAVSLICFSPIDNENRILSQDEMNLYKKITAVFVVIFLFVDVVLFWYNLHIYSVCISIGIILSAALQLPCIVEKMVKNEAK
ncbi:MAG: accessory gene regulator B family protein [Lachnospiraceae bacterium]|nr:accessory gene regulator B family protein [Lachnospiraceae bacterium]